MCHYSLLSALGLPRHLEGELLTAYISIIRGPIKCFLTGALSRFYPQFVVSTSVICVDLPSAEK